MINAMTSPDFNREPLGGLVAAIHKARTSNPKFKQLPPGFIEHSRDLPDAVQTWVERDFGSRVAESETPVFRARAR